MLIYEEFHIVIDVTMAISCNVILIEKDRISWLLNIHEALSALKKIGEIKAKHSKLHHNV